MNIVQACGNTVPLSASTTSANASINFGSNPCIARVQNPGSETIFVRGGVGTQTAVTTDLAVIAGTFADVAFPTGTNNVAVITSTGTATVLITPIVGN